MQQIYSGLEAAQAFNVVHGASFEHRLMSAKSARMAHRHLTLGDTRLETGMYNFPVIARGVMPANALCIGFMAEGGDLTCLNTAQVGADEVQIYPSGAELLYQARGHSRWITFVVPEERLQSVALARTGRPLGMSRHVSYSVRLRSGERAALTRLADDAMNLAQRMQGAGGMDSCLATEIYQALIAGYVDALATAAPPSRRAPRQSAERRGYELVSACEQLMLSGAGHGIALAELARRSGYSLRSLELIFRHATHMAPGRWFMTARLNGALRDLLTCDETCPVAQIAARWGFRHMSRFAQYYRAAFGELPRDTLRRPRPCL
ncbi:helix-turn-helix domain-containing protein [Bordetella petrii]|uniref:helix-turn-helix domain-containing protein n=1 Tax=Bordetella petrii TaxID=94624 RepID=UPI001E656469|nr:helix-turn-helix domain-containing protein [Bordetella petrii]MCD0502016.1 helix-turn-helix domain-containing protein [Bordetella petrii]